MRHLLSCVIVLAACAPPHVVADEATRPLDAGEAGFEEVIDAGRFRDSPEDTAESGLELEYLVGPILETRGRVRRLLPAGVGNTLCLQLIDGRIGCWGYDIVRERPAEIHEIRTQAGPVIDGSCAGLGRACFRSRDNKVFCTGRPTLSPNGSLMAPAPFGWAYRAPSSIPVLKFRDACAVDHGAAMCFNVHTRWWGCTDFPCVSPNENVPEVLRVEPPVTDVTRECIIEGNPSIVRCWSMENSRWAVPHLTGVFEDRVPIFLEEEVSVLAGDRLTQCALANSGKVYCWGENDSGFRGLGHHDFIPYLRPTLVPLSVPVRTLVHRRSQWCVVGLDERLYCWGSFDDPLAAMRRSPGSVLQILEESVLDVMIGTAVTCALDQTASVRCWGWRDHVPGGGIARGSPGMYPEDYSPPIVIP